MSERVTVPPARASVAAYSAAFFVGAWLRRMAAFVAVVYGFESLGGGRWSGLLYLCLVAPYLLSVYAGSVIDVSSKRTVLHIASALPILLFGFLALAVRHPGAGAVAIQGYVVAALIVAYGVVSAFAYPAFLAVIPDLVPPARVGHVTALTSVLSMLCHVCAPLTIGALRLALTWPGVFATLAVLSAIAWLLLSLLRLPGHVPLRTSDQPGQQNELYAFCRRHPRLLALYIAVAVYGTWVVGPLEVLAPLLGQTWVGRDSLHSGAFMATGGVGLLLGAVVGLRLVHRPHVGAWLCGSGVVGTGLLVLMTYVPVAWSFVVFFCGGLLGGAFSALIIAAIQDCSPPHLRGRVLGLFSLILGASPALGGFVAGKAVDVVGVIPATRIIFGLLVLGFPLLFLWQSPLRDSAPASSTS